jgi:hypothetical protein
LPMSSDQFPSFSMGRKPGQEVIWVGNKKLRNTKGEREVLAQKAGKISSDTQTCRYFGLQ